MLDWGCGKGQDVVGLRNAEGYDPHYYPKPPDVGAVYNTVLCTYVLNTIPDYFARAEIVRLASSYLARGAWLYVTIRAAKDCKGWTRRQTWQGYVGQDLENGGFTLIHKTSSYEIWGWQNPL